MSDPVIQARTYLAGLHVGKRYGRVPDPERLAEAQRAFTAAKAERDIRKALAAEPPLTPQQRAELAALLLGGTK